MLNYVTQGFNKAFQYLARPRNKFNHSGSDTRTEISDKMFSDFQRIALFWSPRAMTTSEQSWLRPRIPIVKFLLTSITLSSGDFVTVVVAKTATTAKQKQQRQQGKLTTIITTIIIFSITANNYKDYNVITATILTRYSNTTLGLCLKKAQCLPPPYHHHADKINKQTKTHKNHNKAMLCRFLPVKP